jgi:3-dehydroquinate synthase
MQRIEVTLGTASYDVCIKSGLLAEAATLLSPLARDGQFLVVTDENVARYNLSTLRSVLSAANIALEVYTLPTGEAAKSWSQLEKLTDWLLSHHVERGDHILALGGGVVGDITGFAAHIVKRGCHFVQIPTTLLAQVDSSVGGKTAINSGAGKNLVGAFHQPALVLIDPDVLNTLPRRQLAAGFAEVVKYGLINDPDFFAWCEANVEAFFEGNSGVRSEAIAYSVAAKAKIVAADERETKGVRALLNLGHTFGHALEAETGYSDRLFHGEAVAAGMALAFRYSARRGECDAADAVRVAALLDAAALPTTLKQAGVVASGEVLVAHMLHDKKRAGGSLPFLLARGIGQSYLAKDVELADVAAFLDEEDSV